jgi:SAM-dependent methyltransferase
MTSWDERFREGEYPQNPDPSPVLDQYLSEVPDGRALDVATGTGRNAVFLAAEGYDVDAVDQSREGLRITGENAASRGVESRVNLIQADIPTYTVPADTYSLITVSFYRVVDRLPGLKEALQKGGYLFIEHHLRSEAATPSGPSDDRYRFGANELLQACLDMTVLYYDAGVENRTDGEQRATARILARNTHGQRQSYPTRKHG